jgi:hypothetical protein
LASRESAFRFKAAKWNLVISLVSLQISPGSGIEAAQERTGLWATGPVREAFFPSSDNWPTRAVISPRRLAVGLLPEAS